MKRIEGVEMYLLVNDELSRVADDGYVGQLTEADKAVIGVATRLPVHAFDVDGQKNVSLRRNLAADMKLDPAQYRVYQQRVAVKYGEKTGVWYTEYPQNNLRLLCFGERGSFQTREIALVSQGGKFFLTAQDVYSESCYRTPDGKITCPFLQCKERQWPQFVATLTDLLWDAELPPVSEYQPKTNGTASADKNTAKVLWWNQAQGLGMVAVDKSVSPKGVARVHWSQLLGYRTQNGFAYLEPGEIVSWQATRTPHQTKARATSFVCELIGVALAQ